ncbi:hypothetical protein [Niallia sp. FSL K6-0077]|uniref:hypothetical protein n=1 Tax=Niallia sp. FSL K6-0077 TaxID=2954743 RepID=UPI0030F8AAB3
MKTNAQNMKKLIEYYMTSFDMDYKEAKLLLFKLEKRNPATIQWYLSNIEKGIDFTQLNSYDYDQEEAYLDKIMDEISVFFLDQLGISVNKSELMKLTFFELKKIYSQVYIAQKVLSNEHLYQIFNYEEMNQRECFGYVRAMTTSLDSLSRFNNTLLVNCYDQIKEELLHFYCTYPLTATREQFECWERMIVDNKLMSEEQLMDVLSLIQFEGKELALH